VIEDRLPLHNKKRAAIRRPHMQSARKTKGARSLAAIITSYNRLSSSRGDIKALPMPAKTPLRRSNGDCALPIVT
jgi:hypothetical protein